MRRYRCGEYGSGVKSVSSMKRKKAVKVETHRSPRWRPLPSSPREVHGSEGGDFVGKAAVLAQQQENQLYSEMAFYTTPSVNSRHYCALHFR